MEEQNRTDEFLATLGHEMRNPLSALSNALEVWSKDDPVLMDNLRHIMERQVRHLTRLSDDLLDTARIARGKLEIRREQVQLQKVICDACEAVKPFIDRCRQVLIVDARDEPIVVYGDASRLTQVFTNLLQNAAKFTERNGRLCVSFELQAESVAVRVSDNGCGIEKHLQATLFDGDSRLSETSVCGRDGLGIGLKLVKAIVEPHGGSVAVHSEGLGKGSEFTVVLPLWNSPVRGLPTTNLPLATEEWNEQHLPAYRIVVVNDNQPLGELLARLLRKIGQSVTVADHREEAVRMVLEKRPQVVFLDLAMQEVDGYEFARRLHEYPELDETALIALSGDGSEENKLRALDAGINRYLVKPTSIGALTDALLAVSASCTVNT